MAGEMNTTYTPGSVTTSTAKPAGYATGGSGDSGMLDFLKEMVRRRQSQAVGASKVNPLGQAIKSAPVAQQISPLGSGKSSRDIEMERMQMQQMAAQTAALTQPAPSSHHISGAADYGIQPDYEKFTGAQRAIHMPASSTIGPASNITPEEKYLAKRLAQPAPEPWSLG